MLDGRNAVAGSDSSVILSQGLKTRREQVGPDWWYYYSNFKSSHSDLISATPFPIPNPSQRLAVWRHSNRLDIRYRSLELVWTFQADLSLYYCHKNTAIYEIFNVKFLIQHLMQPDEWPARETNTVH